jgi:hypothetical protein
LIAATRFRSSLLKSKLSSLSDLNRCAPAARWRAVAPAKVCGSFFQLISRPLPPPAHPQKFTSATTQPPFRREFLREESVHHKAPVFLALIPGHK